MQVECIWTIYNDGNEEIYLKYYVSEVWFSLSLGKFSEVTSEHACDCLKLHFVLKLINF